MKPNFTLAPIFSDHMIFQAGKPLFLFGTCQKRREIRVCMCGKVFRFKTTDLTFCFELSPLSYIKEPFEVEVSCNKQVIRLSDCLAGDVFICAGQANIGMPLKDTFENRVKDDSRIRFYDVPKMPYANAHLEFPTYYPTDAKWDTCHRQSAMNFSAIGYHVSQCLKDEMDVPIGIISCSQPETSVFSWAGMLELCQIPGLSKYLNNYRAELTKYKTLDEYSEKYNRHLPQTIELYNEFRQLEKSGIPAPQIFERLGKRRSEFLLPMGPKHPNRPAGTFETMVKSIFPFPVKSILFYQGEADCDHGELYEEAFKAMIKSWRRVFQDPTLPFVFVQIAGFGYPKISETGAALVREAQQKCISFLNNVYMASAVDLGDENNLHPKEKVILSKRIANVILEKVYRRGKNNLSPAYFSYQISENQMIIFTEFNNLNLISHSKQNLGFKISLDGDTFIDTDQISLMNNQILVRNAKKIKELRYCFTNYPHCDIYSTNDLPLLPFRIRMEQ